MNIAGIIIGVIVVLLGICIVILPALLGWIAGIALIITGIVYTLHSTKK